MAVSRHCVSPIRDLASRCYLLMCCVWSVLTESEDEDLHQCGRCRAMFRRLVDYLAHKHSKSCRRFLDCAAQTSPVCVTSDVLTVDCQVSVVDTENVDLGNTVRQSLQASLGDNPVIDDACCSQVVTSVCDEQDEDAALESATDTAFVPLTDITNDVSRSSSADDGGDAMVTSSAGSVGQLVVDEAQSQDQNGEGLPEAPPPRQCPQCEFTSKFSDDFDQHLRRQHGLSCHICVDCSRAYTTAYKLRRHQQMYCTKTPARKKQNALLSGHKQQQQQQLVPRFLALDKHKKTLAGSSARESPFHCRMCSQTYADYDSVQSHVTAVHSSLVRPGICRFCGAWFASLYKLRRHVSSSVHDDIPTDVMTSFKRQIDRMSISYTPEALRLLRRARAERRQLLLAETRGNECAICKQTFSARSALLRHRKVIHGRRSAASASDVAPTISCQLCGASFDRRRAYLRHRRDEHRKLPVVRAPAATKKCSVCGRSFTRADAASRHHSTVHTSHQQLPDDVLPQFVSFDIDDQLFTGTDLDSSATFTCFICAKLSPTNSDLVRHLELFHRVWVPQPGGPKPPGLFDDMPAIPASLQHIDDALAATQTQHLGTTQSGEQIVPDVPVTSSRSKCRGGSTLSSHWTCPYCQRTAFSTLNALYHHKVDYHHLDAVFRCIASSCRLTFRVLADYKAHVTESGHSQAAFICSVCNEHCADLMALISHRSSSHRCPRRLCTNNAAALMSSKQSGSILCDQCGQTFSRRSALMLHRSVVHKRDSCRRYQCPQCERHFVKREHLERHVTSRHATARPYVCCATGCGRAFKRKDKLQEHYRCHSTDRQYACSLCGRTYRQRDGLRYHERTRHRPAPPTVDHPQRRRSCRRCPATFTRAGKLAEHLRTVHGRGAGKDAYTHRCDVCGKTFPRPERVRRHAEREHNVPANWSHRCTVCGKGFAGLRSYEVHMARHRTDAGGGSNGNSGGTTARRGRRRTKVKTAITEASPRVVVVTGRHHSTVRASGDVTRVVAAADAPSTHCFNRFFVASTPSGHRQQQFDQSSQAELRSSRLSSHVNVQSSSLDRLYYAESGLAECSATERLHGTSTDNISTHRRLSFEPLQYLHHPTRTSNDYSHYTPAHHHPATTHKTQFGFYPSAPAGFGYSSHSATACSSTPRGCALFPADRAATAALPFRVQSAEPGLTGQSIERRPTEFGPTLATAFPSVMAGDYGGGTGSSVPLRPLATQPPAGAANAYCPVPDPPTVGRWFDSVPTLLPPPVDASNLDPVRWPPRPCIDSLTVRSRYPFSVEPTSRCHNQLSTVSRSTSDTVTSVAGPSWSSVEHSCLLNCSKMESAGTGLMLGSRRRAVDGDPASLYSTTTGGHRDTGSGVPPHGMLSLLPPW